MVDAKGYTPHGCVLVLLAESLEPRRGVDCFEIDNNQLYNSQMEINDRQVSA